MALPEKRRTNADLEAMLDTSDAWIVARTGIRERPVEGVTSVLATRAARAALETAGVEAESIDLLVLATTTPDKAVPATSAGVAHALGLRCGAFDLNAACSGWVYGLIAASGFSHAGARRMLVLGVDTLSSITDWGDRTTAVLFADGAGAAVVESCAEPGSLLGWDLGSDGSGLDLLYCNHGEHIQMEGREIFRRATRLLAESARRALAKAGLEPGDVDLVVPHQANIRIIEAANRRLGVPMEKTALVIERTGNSSSATIPLALEDAQRAGRVRAGDVVLLTAFGAGLTWASAVLRWQATPGGPRS